MTRPPTLLDTSSHVRRASPPPPPLYCGSCYTCKLHIWTGRPGNMLAPLLRLAPDPFEHLRTSAPAPPQGLDTTAVTPLLSRSAAGEFDSSPTNSVY
eukprot:509244-Prorocentrum_minimum.AAC.1